MSYNQNYASKAQGLLRGLKIVLVEKYTFVKKFYTEGACTVFSVLCAVITKRTSFVRSAK